VTDARQRQGQQPVQELPHPVAAQGDVRADRHALAQLELRDRLASHGHRRLLPGDGGQVADGALDELAVTGGVTDAHVDHDLGQAGHLHRVGVAELRGQRGHDLLAVTGLHPGGHLGALGPGLLDGVGHAHRSLPERTATRVRTVLLRPSRSTVSTRVLIRVGVLVSGSTTITLDTWMGASWTWMPPVLTPRWPPARVCLVMRLTPSTRTRPVSVYTAMT